MRLLQGNPPKLAVHSVHDLDPEKQLQRQRQILQELPVLIMWWLSKENKQHDEGKPVRGGQRRVQKEKLGFGSWLGSRAESQGALDIVQGFPREAWVENEGKQLLPWTPSWAFCVTWANHLMSHTSLSSLVG